MLNILGRQNTTIAQLNADADAIFAQLADRREDVVNFIDNAGRTAAISAERSEDLSRNFDLLDDFLAELQPTMVELEKLVTKTPCSPTAPRPRPQQAGHQPAAVQPRHARLAAASLGRAAAVGKVALDKSKEEIAALNQTSTKAYPPPMRWRSSSRASTIPVTRRRRTATPAETSATSRGRRIAGWPFWSRSSAPT